MAKSIKPIIIKSVFFDYIGTDNDFNSFMRAVIYEYLTKDTQAEESETDKKVS